MCSNSKASKPLWPPRKDWFGSRILSLFSVSTIMVLQAAYFIRTSIFSPSLYVSSMCPYVSVFPGVTYQLASKKHLNRDRNYIQVINRQVGLHLCPPFFMRLLWGFLGFFLLFVRQTVCLSQLPTSQLVPPALHWNMTATSQRQFNVSFTVLAE